VQLSGYSTSGGVTLATFTGIENALGTSFNDALIGNAEANRIAGGAGADWLVGGAGNDTFVQDIQTGVDTILGDAGTDTIDYSGATAGVTVQLSGYSTSGGATLATFSGIESAIGTAFNDALIGTAADNALAGGAGADWLVGGGGADVISGGDGDDRFVMAADAAIDTLAGGAGFDTLDYSGAAAAVTVQLSGYSTFNGGAQIAAFSEIEAAIGTSLNDALIGNAANNNLTGAAGNDWLVGAAGADRFIYLSIASGTDTIADFSRTDGDRILLSAIDADASAGGDQAFAFSTARTSGLAGEAVIANFANASTLSLYLDSDNVADMVIQIIHTPGLVMNAADFVL
jgi:Ca2+-binding RTX toxin-like protein